MLSPPAGVTVLWKYEVETDNTGALPESRAEVKRVETKRAQNILAGIRKATRAHFLSRGSPTPGQEVTTVKAHFLLSIHTTLFCDEPSACLASYYGCI